MRLYAYLKNNADLIKSDLKLYNNQKRIKVNNEFKNLSYELKTNDIVTIDDQIIEDVPFVYYVYNKPVGVICTNNENVQNNIKTITKIKERVYCVGRLDKDSHGLIILTNDNSFCNYVLTSNQVEKEYIVKVHFPITTQFMAGMNIGIIIRNRQSKPCVIHQIDDYSFSIILKEGMNRQIRRMVKSCENKVVDLERIRIGNICLNNLKKQIMKIDYLPIKMGFIKNN